MGEADPDEESGEEKDEDSEFYLQPFGTSSFS